MDLGQLLFLCMFCMSPLLLNSAFAFITCDSVGFGVVCFVICSPLAQKW